MAYYQHPSAKVDEGPRVDEGSHVGKGVSLHAERTYLSDAQTAMMADDLAAVPARWTP